MGEERKWRVGIIGAAGLVGKEVVELLEDAEIPCVSPRLFPSSVVTGPDAKSDEQMLNFVELGEGAFDGLDVVFIADSAAVCQKQIPLINQSGALAIDLSGARGLDDDVPLVVPEVNGEVVEEHVGIMASPAAPTVMVAMVVDALRSLAVPLRVSGTLLLPASLSGNEGIEELAGQTIALLNHKEIPSVVFPQRLAFNAIPDVGGFVSGETHSRLERRVSDEVRKILEEPELSVDLLAVRIPVFVGQAMALEITLNKAVTLEAVRGCFESASGFVIVDEPMEQSYPMPGNAAMNNDVLIGRMRLGEQDSTRVLVWVVSDDLRKGTALNGVQILKRCIEDGMLGKETSVESD